MSRFRMAKANAIGTNSVKVCILLSVSTHLSDPFQTVCGAIQVFETAVILGIAKNVTFRIWPTLLS